MNNKLMNDFEAEHDYEHAEETASNIISGALFALAAFLIILAGLQKAVFLDTIWQASLVDPQIKGIALVVAGTALFVFARWLFYRGPIHAFKRMFEAICLYVPLLGAACLILGAYVMISSKSLAALGVVPFCLGIMIEAAYFGAKK